MKANEGKTDRIARIILGLILLSQLFIGPKNISGIVGLIPLFTGIIGFCPLYKILGLSTCTIKG